jgi:hypothetical protein
MIVSSMMKQVVEIDLAACFADRFPVCRGHLERSKLQAVSYMSDINTMYIKYHTQMFR